jgi:hypothetical protein
MISRKIYLVTTHDNYLIGTQSKLFHTKITKIINNDNPHIRVQRSESYNVASQVNKGLLSYDLIKDYKNITIDTNAILSIKKQNPNTTRKFPTTIITVDEFIMYPFKHYLGIILPYKILDETRNHLIMRANIIDPVEDYKLFNS